ncbi:transcriptional regulator [Vibrio owensii]|uniref:LysR family transcriptional regulator n=1 Tax=Vibrio owensii TaxID=696485 RepID=UPI0003A65A13|nr:LysR family transcriptional regulator [Vibrio owensii]SUP42133.1 transcriptional regulator [Vibrio owensii]
MKHSIDLNLYRFLNLIFEQKSLPKVCHTLDISRATFNRQLADCRELFGNELFIANKGLYFPTLFCSQLMNIIEEPLEQLESAQTQVNVLEAATQPTQFRFFVPNPLSAILTTPLLELLSQHDNIADFSMVDWNLEGIEFPKAGSLAVGISGYPSVMNERVVERKIGELGLYLYTSQNNPLWQHERIDIQRLQNEKLVRVSMGALDDAIYYERVKRQLGFALERRLTVPSVHAALDWLIKTDYVLICFALPDSALPQGIKKIPLIQDNVQMFFDIGLQFHRGYYQHPTIVKLEKHLSDILNDL